MGYPKLFFDNRFADAIPVASTTAAGNYAAANVGDMRPYTWWKPSVLPAALTVECGIATSADYALLHSHNLFTQGVQADVFGSNDNFVTSTFLGTLKPNADEPCLTEFQSAIFRYFRLVFLGKNLLPYSNSFVTGTGWAKNNCTIVPNAIAPPIGSSGASKIVSNLFTGRIGISKAVTVTANRKYALQCKLKSAEWSRAILFIDNATVLEGAYYGVGVQLDLIAGTSSNPAVVKMTALGDGWYQPELAGTPTATNLTYEIVPLNPANNNVNGVVGDGVSGIYVCDCQAETESATAYYENVGDINTRLPAIAIAMIGSAFVMPKFLSEGFDPMGKKSIQQSNNNENGHPLGSIVDFRQKNQTLEFANVTWSWLRSTWDPAWDKSISNSPIVVAWDSVNYPAELQLGKASEEYTAPHKQGGLATLSFGFSGVAT